MIKRLIFFTVMLLSSLIFCKDIEILSADGVMPMNNRNYASNAIKLFDSAQKTIHILMLEGGYYPERPEGVNLKLYQALFRAVQRGVDVKIIIDYSGFNPSQNVRNQKLGDFLASNNVKVYYDDPDVTTHSKTLIVDSLYSVIGSTNWSYHALEKNNECSVLIKSAAVALQYEKYFTDVLGNSKLSGSEDDKSSLFIKKEKTDESDSEEEAE
ncbi:MAG: phospholipase D-like domain-containing protein [bacterium]